MHETHGSAPLFGMMQSSYNKVFPTLVGGGWPPPPLSLLLTTIHDRVNVGMVYQMNFDCKNGSFLELEKSQLRAEPYTTRYNILGVSVDVSRVDFNRTCVTLQVQGAIGAQKESLLVSVSNKRTLRYG